MAIYRKLNRESRIRRSILAGLTKDVINNGYVVTTDARAKEARKYVDRMITRRKALAFLHNDKKTVTKLFDEVAKKYETRNGGYTRIIKLKERIGDDALEVKLELV